MTVAIFPLSILTDLATIVSGLEAAVDVPSALLLPVLLAVAHRAFPVAFLFESVNVETLYKYMNYQISKIQQIHRLLDDLTQILLLLFHVFKFICSDDSLRYRASKCFVLSCHFQIVS